MITQRTFLIGSLIGSLALTACVNPEYLPEGDPDRNDQTTRGAVAGGVAGAAIGLITGDDADSRRRNAVIGGIAGAGIGAALGNQLDRQEAALRRDLGNDNIEIQNTGDSLIVTMPEDILFAVNSTALRPDLRSDLSALAGNLQEFPNNTVRIIGHTDNTGSAEYNQELSLRRARAVEEELRFSGAPAGRLVSIGAGEDQPVASNQNETGRAQNRRVEIVILPTTA